MDVKITVLVSQEMRRQAKAVAAMHGVTLSEVVRTALERLIAEGTAGETSQSKPSAATTAHSNRAA